jgi:trimeric autotransporter adhesin
MQSSWATPASQSVTVTVIPIFPTATLSASSTSIFAGQLSTLTWGSTNASSSNGNGFLTGGALLGSVSVAPSMTTTYSVTCFAPNAAPVSASTTISVMPVSATLTANPQMIATGGSTLLTWGSANATACAGTGFSTGGATSGSVSASPLATTIYEVACGRSGLNAEASVLVDVPINLPP